MARKPGFWEKHGDQLLDYTELAARLQITCKTPPPATERTPEVPPKLEAAHELRTYEEILRFFQAYLEGSFEQGVWLLVPGRNRYYGAGGIEANARLNAWYNNLRNVADWPGRDADAVRMVNHLLDHLPRLIRDQDYTVFPTLMRCCFYLSIRRPALGREVLRFVAQLCSIVLGKHHPMTLAWFRIQTLSMQEYLYVLHGTAKVRFDHLESRLASGRWDENTIHALREYLLVLRLRGPTAVSEIEHVASRALDQVAQSQVLSDEECRLLLGVASSYITCRRFDAAEAILDRVGAHVPSSSAVCSARSQTVFSTYLFIMGLLRYMTVRADEAVNYFLQTYQALETVAGPQSSAVADILLALIDLPGLLQDPKDAEHWQQRLAQVQSDMLARAEKGSIHAQSELSGLWDEPLDTDVNTSAW